MKLFSFRLSPTLALLKNAGCRLLADDGIELAGFIAYTALVALFPFVIFLFALAGFLGHAASAEAAVAEFLWQLPREVRDTLRPILLEVMNSEQPGLLTLGIVGTLWVTSSGVEALRMGLNRAFDAEETRPVWRRRLESFGFVVTGALASLVASLLMIAAPLFEQWLSERMHIPAGYAVASAVLRVLLASCIIAALLAMLFKLLPNRAIRWREVWPGAWLASFAWLALASLFSLYLTQFGNYSITYGSLGGVVITLLFLHFSGIVFLFGAEYNAALHDET